MITKPRRYELHYTEAIQKKFEVPPIVFMQSVRKADINIASYVYDHEEKKTIKGTATANEELNKKGIFRRTQWITAPGTSHVGSWRLVYSPPAEGRKGCTQLDVCFEKGAKVGTTFYRYDFDWKRAAGVPLSSFEWFFGMLSLAEEPGKLIQEYIKDTKMPFKKLSLKLEDISNAHMEE